VHGLRARLPRRGDRAPGLLPILDPARCVRCGACTRVCLSGTLQVGRRGWRVQVGGKLGRTPASGRSFPASTPREGVLAAAGCCLDLYLRHSRAASVSANCSSA